jgi:hypothetical protein
MKTLAAIAVLLLTMAPVQAQTANLTGKWTGTLTRTAPDGRSQSIDFMFDLTQKGRVLTGTAGPNAERQWAIEKGAVDGSKVTFRVQQPDGPLRTFTLTLVKGRLQGDMLAELNGQSFTAKVDVGRGKKVEEYCKDRCDQATARVHFIYCRPDRESLERVFVEGDEPGHLHGGRL